MLPISANFGKEISVALLQNQQVSGV